jgi:hypothetical protein
MSKIIDAQDILADAQGCIECMFMAMNDLDLEEADPLQSVANVASKKIDEAIALLEEYRAVLGEGPVEYTAPPAAEPKTARTKRKGK